MESELLNRWQARIIACEVSLLAPAVHTGAQFLLQARNEDNTWGPYKGLPFDLVPSASALESLEACGQTDFEADIRNSRFALVEHIRKRVDILRMPELTAALRIMARSQRSENLCSLLETLVRRVTEQRIGVGWGSPAATIPQTAEVLSALASYQQMWPTLTEETKKLLLDEQNEDGGWSVALGSSESVPLASALAIYALIQTQPSQEGRDFGNAARYLRSIVERGWAKLVEDGGVESAALVLRAAAGLRSFSLDAVLRGVEAILDQRNADGAWGERKGGISNVEATAACVTALCTAGGNRLVPSKIAAWAVQDAAIALGAAQQELDRVRSDVRAEVKKQNKALLAENDRLTVTVNDLEKEKRILLNRIDESERSLKQISSARSYDEDERRGSQSVLSNVGFWDFLRLVLARSRKPLTYLGMGLATAFASVVLFNRVIALLGPKLSPVVLQASKDVALAVAIAGAVGFTYTFVRSLKDPLRLETGGIGTSDRKLVQRRLVSFLREWSGGTREAFLHQLADLSRLSPDSREAASRSMAREFATSAQQFQELRVILSLLANLPVDEQRALLYSLRELRGPVAAS